MYVKVLIVYLVCFYVLNTVSLFKPLQQRVYSSFYVKDENNIRGLMYEPYDFSDIRNILLGILITPYGLSVLLFLFITVILGYLSYRWFITLFLLSYIILIIAHYFVYTKGNDPIDAVMVYFIRFIPLLFTIFNYFFGSAETYYENKKKIKREGITFILVIIAVLIDYIVIYNYIPEEGKYDINNKEDYNRVFVPKWEFVSQLIPIYILLFVILRENVGLNNTFVMAGTIGLFVSIGSYILY